MGPLVFPTGFLKDMENIVQYDMLTLDVVSMYTRTGKFVSSKVVGRDIKVFTNVSYRESEVGQLPRDHGSPILALDHRKLGHGRTDCSGRRRRQRWTWDWRSEGPTECPYPGSDTKTPPKRVYRRRQKPSLL